MSAPKRLLHDRPAVVLLVEDNENDIELTRICFEQSDFAVDLQVVRDGEACLAYLRNEGEYRQSTAPDLVLLDLHMPRMSGMDVLESMDADERFRPIPVVILTTSNSEREISEAYMRHCRGYIVKPVGFAEFARLLGSVAEYWFSAMALPQRITRS